MTNNDSNINELLTRAVGAYIDPGDVFRKKLIEKPESVVIKFGVDPTRPDIHLGHAVVLRKLRQFQDMGCKVIFLIGDLTARIGDPTGKSKIRPEVDQAEIEVNMKTYLDQVGKILRTDDSKVFAWIRNSDWFVSMNDIIAPDKSKLDITSGDKKISIDLPGNHVLAKAHFWVETRMQKDRINNYSFLNVMSILRKITLGRLIERDMFQDRIKSGDPIYMHEMMYPILQGIDSNAIAEVYGSCDLEVGGTDQTFNMLVGRDVMEMNNKEPQAVLSFELLEGLDGKEKMSKSLDNYISIIDDARDMYGKVMSIPDELITRYFTLCTYHPSDDIGRIEKNLKDGKINPRDAKMSLAKEIVSIYHGNKNAEDAEQNFIKIFSKGEIPNDTEELNAKKNEKLMDVLISAKLIESKSEWRRLVEAGAITRMEKEQKVEDVDEDVGQTTTLKIGKKRFIKISAN